MAVGCRAGPLPCRDAHRRRRAHQTLRPDRLARPHRNHGLATELLLFEAAYTFFDGSAWRAPVERFTQLGAPAQGQTWTLGAPAGRLDYIEVSGHVDGSGAILALPSGTRSVAGLAANSVARNSLGSVKVADTAPYLKFDVAYAPGEILQPAPTAADLSVPRPLEPLFFQVRRRMAPSIGNARAVRGRCAQILPRRFPL